MAWVWYIHLYIFPGEATSYILNVALKARSRALGPLHPSFNIVKYLRDGMEAFLPSDAHIKASGHLFVSLTRVYDRKNVLVSQFDTREDLIEVNHSNTQMYIVSMTPPPAKKN